VFAHPPTKERTVLKLTSLFLVLAVAGVLAGSSLGVPTPATGVGAKPGKCIKWKKKHGKRVCVKRAKPKPKPTGTTTTTTTPATPTAPNGHYSANTSQNTTLQFDLSNGTVSKLALTEIDSTCQPGSWLGGNHISLTAQTATLSPTGTFTVTAPITFTDGSTGTLAINGTVNVSGATSGTLTWSNSYTAGGTAYTCASGTVTWSGGTGATAAPALFGPKLGHYTGITTQNNHIQFDLVVDGNGYLGATNVSVDEIDESCNPAANLTVTGFYFGSFPFFVNASGHMHAAFADPDQTFVLDATIDTSGHATGSLHDSYNIPYAGETFACDSGAVTWTAALG
jgi:hypothetical protein